MPSKSHRPAVGATRPDATRATVVLPAPFEPSSASTRPGCSASETPKIARNGPYPASTSRPARGAVASSRAAPRPSDEVSEVGLADGGVGEHLVGRVPTRSACRSRGRRRARRSCERTRRRARRAGSRCRARAAPRATSPRAPRSRAVEARRRFVEQHELGLQSSARARSRPGARPRGSATRPCGRRRARARADRASPARAPARRPSDGP